MTCLKSAECRSRVSSATIILSSPRLQTRAAATHPGLLRRLELIAELVDHLLQGLHIGEELLPARPRAIVKRSAEAFALLNAASCQCADDMTRTQLTKAQLAGPNERPDSKNGLRETRTCLTSAGSACSAWVMRSTNVRRMFATRFGCMLAIRYTSRTLKIHKAHDDIALRPDFRRSKQSCLQATGSLEP